MMGKTQNSEPKLFYHNICLESRIPQDHPIRKIKQLVNFNFIRSRVEHLYGANGNVSIDPAVILKLMFLLYYENVKSVRRLLSQLPLRLDWLWFCGYDIDDVTPDHSVLSKARRRWGKIVFAEFFQNILEQCIRAGLVDGQTIHIDSSMIDADASMDSLQPQLRQISQDLYDQLEQQEESDTPPLQTTTDTSNPPDDELGKRFSTTDPDARLGKKYSQTTLGYKDHRVVDDRCGIVTATITTPANVNDGKVLQQAIQKHEVNSQTFVQTVVADAIYGTMDNYQYLHDRGTAACISHQRHSGGKTEQFSRDRFSYDSRQDYFICPAGQKLTRYDHRRPYQRDRVRYRADRRTCQSCRFFAVCVSSAVNGRQVIRNERMPYVEWAEYCMRAGQRKRLQQRRRYKAEGSFADAANNHGFKRARFRGLEQVAIQNLLIVAVQNLRKLLDVEGRRAAGSLAVLALKDFFALFSLLGLFCRSVKRDMIAVGFSGQPV